MTTEPTSFDQIQPEIDDAASGMGQKIVSRLAERLGGAANARAVFGAPVEKDGVTVIPVAKVSWGFGGGGGSSSKEGHGDSGEGGGGGAHAKPLGFIEIRDGQASFMRFRDPGAYVVPLLATAVSAWLILRGLRSLFH
jgi:uncharacterized spore protein YtfJ